MLPHAIRIDHDTIRTIKSDLRFRLPSVGSAHLSEALAASLGFRTSVALKTALSGTALVAIPSPSFGAARLAAIGGLPPGMHPSEVEVALGAALAAIPALPYRPDLPLSRMFGDPLLRRMATIREAAEPPKSGFDDPFLDRLSGFVTLSYFLPDDGTDLGIEAFARLADGIPLEGVGWWLDHEKGEWSKRFSVSGETWILAVAPSADAAHFVTPAGEARTGPRSAGFLRDFLNHVWRAEFPRRGIDVRALVDRHIPAAIHADEKKLMSLLAERIRDFVEP